MVNLTEVTLGGVLKEFLLFYVEISSFPFKFGGFLMREIFRHFEGNFSVKIKEFH